MFSFGPSVPFVVPKRSHSGRRPPGRKGAGLETGVLRVRRVDGRFQGWGASEVQLASIFSETSPACAGMTFLAAIMVLLAAARI